METKIPLIVIFGRTNVGKSTLFNCLTESKQALVAPIEGTTRDSNTAQINWRNAELKIIDTGGIMDINSLTEKSTALATKSDIDIEVQKRARAYLLRADLVFFLVDAKSSLLPQDKQLSAYIKKIIKNPEKIILVANKTDSPKLREKISEFYQLALGDPIGISAVTGSGTGDLLDAALDRLKKLKVIKSTRTKTKAAEKPKYTKVCILGKPNVGKSSLLNAIVGEKRVIVSPIPHTTREPQDTDLVYAGRHIKLIDTAGMSRQGIKRNRENKKIYLEKQGIAMTLDTLGKADIVLFVIDINEELTHQDSKIIQEIVDRKKSLVIIANKWDLAPEKDTKKYTEYIYGHLPFITWVPIQFISSLTGEKINKILDLVIKMDDRRNIRIEEAELKAFLLSIMKRHKPTKSKGFKRPFLYSLTQVKFGPPQFELMAGTHDHLAESYIRFIENQIRKQFDIIGTPLSMYINKKRPVLNKKKEEEKDD